MRDVISRRSGAVRCLSIDDPLKSARARPAIVIAQPSEMEELFHFRYSIYVEEMNRRQKYAHHAIRQIHDPLDNHAVNLIAKDAAGAIVATMRVNFSNDGDLLQYEAFYEMRAAGNAHPQRTCICTRLMIAPAYRHSPLAVRLAVAGYAMALDRGMLFSFIDCNQPLEGFFLGLGFRQHIPKKFHEEYGDVTCMRLDLHDRSHLAKEASPFLLTLDRWRTTNERSGVTET